MKKALIAGFFDLIEESVRQEFGAAIDRGHVLVVGLGRVDPRRGMNVESFKKAFSRLTDSGECTEILVALGRSRSASWVEDAVLKILASHEGQHRIELEVFDDLRDSAAIIKRLGQFGLTSEPADGDSVALTQQLAGQRVYCVRAATQPSFERTLTRLGFVFDAQQFVEEVVPPSRNSNLIQTMSGKADQFQWVLYAWAGLRTLPADMKKKFHGHWLEADSPTKVCLMLKRRLLKQAAPADT